MFQGATKVLQGRYKGATWVVGIWGPALVRSDAGPKAPGRDLGPAVGQIRNQTAHVADREGRLAGLSVLGFHRNLPLDSSEPLRSSHKLLGRPILGTKRLHYNGPL
jgi:hypothetical protein